MSSDIDPLDRPLADLAGHHLDILTRCQCARVVQFEPERLVARLGPGTTLRTAAARLICQDCQTRPRLLVSRSWATSGGRDRRVDPPALPDWVVPILER